MSACGEVKHDDSPLTLVFFARWCTEGEGVFMMAIESSVRAV